MGVLACDRRGCKNIMCDYYNDIHGYICYECITELQEYLDKGNINIGRFMDSNRAYKQDFLPLDAREIFTLRHTL